MTLEQFIESEAQRLFAALGARHGRDIDFYRLLARRCIEPTPQQLEDAMNAVRRVEEFLGRGPVHIATRAWMAWSICRYRFAKKVRAEPEENREPPPEHL